MAHKKIVLAGMFAISAFAAALFGCKDQKASGAATPPAPAPAPTVTAPAVPVPEAASDAAVAVSAAVDAGWEKALDEYEGLVDKYIELMKAITANPADTAIMEQITALQAEAEKIPEMLANIQSTVSAADLEKYQQRVANIAAKQAQAAQ